MGARRPGADLLALGAALAVLAALSALLGSRVDGVGGGDQAPVRALLLDRSASATRGRPGWQRWAVQQLAREAQVAAEQGEEVAVVTFARDVERRFGPAGADELLAELRRGRAAAWLEPSGADDLASDLEGAAGLAAEILGSGERLPGTIVVLGDGRVARGELPSALFEPMVRGVQRVQPPQPVLPDFGVRSVQVPMKVEPGARVPVRLEVFLDGPAREAGGGPSLIVEWELAFRSALQTEASRTLRGRETVAVPAVAVRGSGVRSFGAMVELPPLTTGVGELSVAVRPASLPAERTDNFPENDRASTLLRVGNPVRVLVVAPAVGSSSLSRRLPAGPAFDGIDFEVIAPQDLRARLVGEGAPDVVVTLDVPLAGLPAPALSRFVLGGGGWVRCAGWTALREDGPELRPLLALVPDREPRRPMDIAFLVDGSGSMGGLRWERVRDALGAIVPTTAARDRMELRFFTQVVTQPKLVFEASSERLPDRTEARQEAVEALVRARVPGGSTDILYSLDGLAAAREERRPMPSGAQGATALERPQGMVVLITDGLTDSVWSLRGEVRTRIEAAGDRLVVVLVGEDPDGVEFLSGLLLQGEALVEAGEMEGLEDLLHQELQDVRLLEGAKVVEAPASAEPAWVEPLRAAALEAAALGDGLRLARVLRSRPAEGASALLEVQASRAGGKRGALIALVERGGGTVAGVALPRLGLGSEAWNPALRSRLAWFAPVLRSMARRAREARSAQRSGGPAATPRGALTPGGGVVIRGLPEGLPGRFDATIFGAPEVDLFGELGPSKPLGSVTLSVPRVGAQPDRVRAGRRPGALDRIPRGTRLLLELPAPAGPLTIRADGPAEAYPGSGEGAHWAAGGGLSGSPGEPSAASSRRGPAGNEGKDWPHPLTPWLLWGAVLGLLAGALGGPSALTRRRNGHSPPGQGSRTATNQPNGTLGQGRAGPSSTR